MPSVPVLFDDEAAHTAEEEHTEKADQNYPEVMLEPLHVLDALCLKWKLDGLTTPPPPPEPEAPAAAPALPASPPAPSPMAPPMGMNAPLAPMGMQAPPMMPPMGMPPALPPSSRQAGGYLRLLGILSTGVPWECSLPLADMARQGGLTLGRDPSCCEIVLQEPSISRRHVVFEYLNNRVVVTDQNSTNGTFLNDRRLSLYEARMPLQGGNILKLGDVSLGVEIFAANGTYI